MSRPRTLRPGLRPVPRGPRLGAVVAAGVSMIAATAFGRGGAPAIAGGDPADRCAWPTVVNIVHATGQCSGTLVHPQLVVTAAHCVIGVEEIMFGEDEGAPVESVVPTVCEAHPEYDGTIGMGVDFGFCELPTAIDVPIVPPLMGCEVDAVAVGMPVTLVGFGRDEENVRGIKRAVTTTLNDIDNSPMQPTLEYWIGDLTAGGCRGDSGGPAFVEMVDGTWRVLGVASWAALLGYACGFGSSYGKLHEAVAWIEATSGFDITGCHDAGGAWNPGPQCQGFPLEPQAGTASWPRGCASSLQDMAQTCAVPDVAAPEVAIVEPIDGATFELLSDTTVAIAFEGTIYDASGRLETAELRIDGTVAATSAHPPFRWPLRMPPGSHEIELFARDRSGNENAAKVAIEVTEDGAGSSRGSSEGSSETIAGSDATSTGGNPSQGSHGSVAPLPQQGEDGCACRSEPAIMPFAWIWLGVLGLRRRTDRRLNLRDHTPKSPPISRHK